MTAPLMEEVDRLAGMMEGMRDDQRATRELLNKLVAAFPEGDVEGHRRYHEAVIERIELRNKLVRESLVKMVQAGTLAAMGWFLVAIWRAFKFSLTQ